MFEKRGARLSRRALRLMITETIDRPVLVNIVRGSYVERLVVVALGPPWTTTEEWDSWDITHPGKGWRVEVKQSAARQSWHRGDEKSSEPSFDIGGRKYHWDGAEYIGHEIPTRAAHVYVFAWNGESDMAKVDHRDITQWEFYVARSDELPDQKSIALNPLRRIVDPVPFDRLKKTVETMLEAMDV